MGLYVLCQKTLNFFSPCSNLLAVWKGRRRLCDDAGRLLRGVCGLRCDWFSLVGVVREENEAAAGTEPSCMEVQSELVTAPLLDFHTLLENC